MTTGMRICGEGIRAWATRADEMRVCVMWAVGQRMGGDDGRACLPVRSSHARGRGTCLRPANRREPATRGSGDKCGDLMFFSLVCLMFFIDYGFARSLNVVSFLVSSVRPVGRLVFSIRSSHCFPVVLVRLVGRLVSRLVQSSRLACSFRSSHLRLPWASPSLRLVVSSRPWRLACSSRFFSFVLSPCGYVMRRSCGGGVLSVSFRWACCSFVPCLSAPGA